MTFNTPLTNTCVDAPSQTGKARLLFADDNPAVLRQVCSILKGQFDIVGTLSSGEEVQAQWTQLAADVIILDISMGHLSGLDVARILRESGCKTPIVFLTVHTGADCVSAALTSGGTGYVVKSHMLSDLVPAIKAAMAGELFVSPSAS